MKKKPKYRKINDTPQLETILTFEITEYLTFELANQNKNSDRVYC